MDLLVVALIGIVLNLILTIFLLITPREVTILQIEAVSGNGGVSRYFQKIVLGGGAIRGLIRISDPHAVLLDPDDAIFRTDVEKSFLRHYYIWRGPHRVVFDHHDFIYWLKDDGWVIVDSI